MLHNLFFPATTHLWNGKAIYPLLTPNSQPPSPQDSHVTAVFEGIPGAPALPAASLELRAILAAALAALGIWDRR
jgi:hypothetical protein